MSENTILFSIVIPTYNRAQLITKTLNSVFTQTFTNYELIVVDNCSTDNTKEVLAPYISSGKIKFIQHDKNYERAKSRNTGMANATGKFVTFLDSDDLMYPDNLKDAATFIQTNSNCHLFQNLYELVNQNNLPIYQYNFRPINNHIRDIAKGNFFSCIGVFISKEIYKKYRFDTHLDLQGIEDWEFWMRIMADYVPGRINKINSGIVHHPGRSITHYALESFITKKDYVLTKFHNDPHLNNIYKGYFSSFNTSCYMLAASNANSGHMYDKALFFLKRAIYIQPMLIFNIRFLKILQKAIFKVKHKQGI